jgi:hypothetical protein
MVDKTQSRILITVSLPPQYSLPDSLNPPVYIYIYIKGGREEDKK